MSRRPYCCHNTLTHSNEVLGKPTDDHATQSIPLESINVVANSTAVTMLTAVLLNVVAEIACEWMEHTSSATWVGVKTLEGIVHKNRTIIISSYRCLVYPIIRG